MKLVSVGLVGFLYQFIFILPFSESRTACPNDWKAIHDSCIHVSNVTVSWQDAQSKCDSMGGSKLVTVKNLNMNNQISDILKNVSNFSYSEFYIGLSINKSDKVFKWVDGTSYDYSNWRHPNTTNVTFPSGVNVLCGFYGADLRWLLKSCNATRRFICQRDLSSLTTPGPSGNNSTLSPPPSSSSLSSTTTTTATKATKATIMTPFGPTTNTTARAPSTGPSTGPKSGGPGSLTKPTNQTTTMPPTSTTTSQAPGLNSSEIKSDMTIEDILAVVKKIEKEGKKRIDEIKRNGNVSEPKVVPLYKTTSLVAEVAVVPVNANSSLTFPSDNLRGNIMLPNVVFNVAKKLGKNSEPVGITSVFLPGLGKTDGNVLNSGVISTKVDVPSGINSLTDPVVISLPHGKALKADQNPSCAFINVSTSKWSTVGCHVFSSNSTFTVCHCSHLTSFAVLMDVHGTHDEMPEKHRFALLVVSIVGCCIALVCFVAALIAFYLIVSERRRRKTETVSIHKNLAIAEIFALIFFLVAYVATDSKEACFAVAFLLHYFLMAVFFWMLIEGINLHRGLVQVFVTSSRMKVYYVLGWVTPILFVVPTAAVGGMDYMRDDFCWISQQFIWVFAGPVAFILLVNLIILCIAIHVMIKRPRYKMNRIEDSSNASLEQELRIAFKTTVILLPLLGLTWCLGFFVTHSTTGNIVIQYLFAVINSLQGLYFFFAHCVYDEDVVKATSNTSTRIKSYFSRTLSHSGRSGSASLSSNSKQSHNSAYHNATYDGRVFEMPSYSSEANKQKISVDTTSTKASVIANGNHPNVVTNGPEDATKQENTNPVPNVPLHRNSLGFDAYFGGKKPSPGQDGLEGVPQDTGTPDPQFFRRARSAIVKLSSTHTYPKRANSLSEHFGTRRPLSKQTSNDSSHSGNSNTPILFSGC